MISISKATLLPTCGHKMITFFFFFLKGVEAGAEPRACRSTRAGFRFFSMSTAAPTASWVLCNSSWGGLCTSWKRGRPPHWFCIFKMLRALMLLLGQFLEKWPKRSRATSSKYKTRVSRVADRVFVLQPGVRPKPLRWESQVQDMGPPETSRLHVISNGKSSLGDFHLNTKTQLHSMTSKLQCWTPYAKHLARQEHNPTH